MIAKLNDDKWMDARFFVCPRGLSALDFAAFASQQPARLIPTGNPQCPKKRECRDCSELARAGWPACLMRQKDAGQKNKGPIQGKKMEAKKCTCGRRGETSDRNITDRKI